MKKVLLTLFGLLSLNAFSQAITVNTNSHTPTQLVNNVLVQNSCLVQITNVQSRTGINSGTSHNGIGFYQNTNSAFPVTGSGVLLSTGQAQLAPGPNTTLQSNGSNSTWGGDAGLEAALASAGITMNSNNASVLEFDFVPNTANFGFDFLFASEEYGTQFQCTSNDAFVVLLTQGSTTQNVAVIPSTSIPITVSNIRNNLYWSGCPSANAAFFGAFNGGGNAAGSATNFNGQSVLMHASATVIPNVPYHIRIVIADDGGVTGTDGNYDSAVFIPAGSLNLGQKLFPQDLTIANGNALCFGQTYTLNTGLDETLYTFTWKRGTTTLPETGPSLTVNQPGQYSVTLNRADLSCTTTQTINIEYRPEIMAGTPLDLQKCYTGAPTYNYDLSQNTPIVKQGLDPGTTITYHSTPASANNTSDTGLPTTYNAAPGTTVWVRAQVPNGCFTIRQFQLLTSPAPVAGTAQPITLCESAQGSNSAVFDLTQQINTILNGQDPAQNQVRFYTSLPAANNGVGYIETPESYTGTTQTIYVRLQKTFDTTCYSISQFNITVKPLPVLPASSTVNACNSYTLPAIAGANYYTGIGGTGTMYTAGTNITTSQLLYIYAQSGGTPNCSNQSDVTINIITAATAPPNVTACVSYELPTLPIGEYRTAPAGGGAIINPGTILTATQTIYYFIPSAASCTQNNSFTVTITSTPVVTDQADVVSCGPYTLPTLPNGEKYFTGPNGTGTQLANGFQVNSSQTIYIYTTNPSNPDCTAQSDFNVTVHLVDVIDAPDVTECFIYHLPALTVGKYYTAPNGGGANLPFGSQITTTQTIYIYAQSPVDPSCNDQDSFLVTINSTPTIPPINNVTACGSYTLPAVANASYYTGPNGTGTMLPAGSVITTTQTLYVSNQTSTTPPCIRQRIFTVTILDISTQNPGNQTACASYTLPPLTLGKYYTGPNGTGTMLNPGQNITTVGANTIYIYATSTTTPVCSVQESFVVTIIAKPSIPIVPNVIACNSYTLPPAPIGNYYTGVNGTGTMLPAGTIITTDQVVHIYAESATTMTPPCSRNRPFSIDIINSSIAPANVTACGHYLLPALPVGQYRTAPAGGGNVIPVGTDIFSTQTIYVYSPVADPGSGNCTDDDSFVVTINPAVQVDTPGNANSCVSYQLPPLTHGNYFTAPNGGGTPLFAGQLITSNQTIYIYNSSTGVNCSAQHSFNVTILDITVNDLPDVTVCAADGYTLPAIPVGNYYTGPGGTGAMLNPGDIITTTQTIYIYAATTTPPVCTDEESFVVTIKQAPVIDNPGNVGSCGNYVLPPLTNGDYYTGTAGTGTHLFAGQVISATTQLYIFAETGGTPNCVAENVFNVIINPAAPDNVTACDSYTLPVLTVGDYFTGPAGTGTPKFAGDVITTSQVMYVYVNLGTTPNCTDTNSFSITINNSPVLDPVAPVITECDRYELPALTVGNYYTQPAGQGTLLPAGTFINSSQTVYRYAETATTPACITEDSFDVVIYQTPIADARSDVPVCGSYQLDALLVGNYFTGPLGTGTPLFAGDIINTTQTIYIYATNPAYPACFTENSFLVEVFSITADAPANVTRCDSYVLPALTVGKYYANPGGPNPTNPAANPEIPVGTVINTPGVNTLYVYAETGGRINCTDENSFTVTIYPTPVVDDSQGNVAQCTAFTLPALTSGNYFTGPNGTGAPLSAGAVITTPTTVYVYAASDPAGACFDQHSFFVDVNIVDVTAPANITTCGVYTLPALASGNYYTATNGGGTMLTAGQAITTSQTIYVYAQGGTTVVCSDEESFTVNIITAPQIFVPAPLVVCGVDAEGHGVFNLQPALNFALGGQPDTDVRIYETQEDADFDNQVNQIPNVTAYGNIDPYNQTVYIRVFSTVSDCYSLVPVQLVVNDRPVATEPQPRNLCDDDNDGFAVFNLTSVNNEVLGTLNASQHTIRYYRTLADAEAGGTTGEITSPVAFNTQTTTVYIRVQNNATTCYDVVALDLIVNPLPVAVQPTPLTMCDNTGTVGHETFDLTTKITEITTGINGVTVTFYHTFAQAQAGGTAGRINNPEAYVNGPTVETLFARVTSEAGCYRIVLLDVRVEPLPELTMPDPADVTVCDADADGFAQFDLQALIPDMVNGATNYQVTMYYTAEDAETGLNQIPNLTNYVTDEPNDIIYVRVVNTATGCVNYSYSFMLNVNLAPQMPTLDDISVCDTDTNNNGQTLVDLTQQNADIIAAIGSGYTIQYFTSEANAILGAPRITTPTAYPGTNGQEIWVRATDGDLCFGITSFFLEIVQPLVLTTPTPFTKCNEALPNDGITEFDLTTKDNEILGPFGVGQGFTVQYYTRNSGTPVNSNPIVNPTGFTLISNPATYTNVATVQTLYVVVTSPAPASCSSFTTLTIRVLPLPIADTTPNALEVCDDDTDGQAIFDLTDAEADIRDNDNTTVITWYTSQAAAEAGVAGTEIATPNNYLAASGTVYVRVEANTNNPADPKCYQVVALELIVNPLPVLGDPATGTIAPYAICEIPFDGVATFLLNSHIPQILVGQNAADYTVKFYRDAAALTAGTAMPNQYTNTTSPNSQTILVQVKNNDTGCISVGSLTLLVEPGAVANPVTNTTAYEVCDTDGTNDGVETFDLTPLAAQVLGTQNPAQFSVMYYESQAAAEAGLPGTEIATPAAYMNTFSPDLATIWIRVTNTSTVSGCHEVTSFDIQVERLPEPVITSDENSDTLCFEFNAATPLNSLTLHANVTGAGYSYQWQRNGTDIPGAINESLTVAQEGDYTVVVTSPAPFSCVSDVSPVFEVIKSGPAERIGMGYIVSNAFSDEQIITINVQGHGTYEYRLDNGPWQVSNIFTDVTPGEHKVTVRDTKTGNPCDDLVIDEVSIIDYPRYFTPNGDGYHDTWNVIGLGNDPSNTKTYIFDRFGKLIKQISADGAGWDGTMSGNQLPADDYWFTVKYRELMPDGTTYVEKEFKSHFSLKR